MITVRIKYTPEELIDILSRNVTEFVHIDRNRISKADLQAFAEQLHSLRLIDNRTGVPMGYLTKKLVMKRINEIMVEDDPTIPDPPDGEGGACPDSGEWSTIEW